MLSTENAEAKVNKGVLEPFGLPVVVEPRSPGEELASWAVESRAWIAKCLLRQGAILFRGFGLREVADFEKVLRAISPSLINYFEGTSPRRMVSRTVYTSTEYPPELMVSLHNEMSYAHKWPGKIFFFCVTPPERGGETPVADSRRVHDLIPEDIRGRFREKGVLYVRNLHGGRGAGLSWQTVFETDDRSEVERYCHEGQIDFEWRPGGGLRTTQLRPAIVSHPQTGESLWFNQAHNFHPSDLGEEDAEDLLAVFGEDGLPNNACYGDGAPIEASVMRTIRVAYDAAMIRFPWQKGDLLMLDNMMIAHGRMPFSGPRKIVVAMGEPVSLSELS
jgi:alpha-ketoglutarate-dependent taurine dioxygenase